MACGALALGAAALRKAPPEKEIGALALALGERVHHGGNVSPEDVRWEPSGGSFADYTIGRWALFLGSDAAKSPRDVYRARVRLTPEGRPIDVGEAHNLTSTPLGDDHALVLRDTEAAFGTFAYGQEQSVSILDLAGEARAALNLRDSALSYLTNAQQTGSGAGIRRVDVTLDQPAKRLGLTLAEDHSLAIDLAFDNGVKHATFDPARGELVPAIAGMHAEAARHLPKPFILWAVDTVRAVSWIGPAPIAWLEERVFALRDAAKQLAFKLHGADATETLADASELKPPPATILDGSKLGGDDASWPPASMPSIWKTPEPGEGQWQAPKLSWMKKSAPGAPPMFVRTFVRPDQERPYVQVILVAMDMRQLDLEMEAGTEDPKPLTGNHGPGRIPRDPAIATRVVAEFNGAFKTEHGNYGMMVHKRVLLPPQPGAASVVLFADGRVGFGSWGNSHEVTGIRDIPDSDIVSFRQNLDPLVDLGQVNPTKRALWGYTLPGNGMQTERSGMCTTASGHVIYAWGDDVSATVLGKAMLMAGCSYGMHLDMNPHHTGFIFSAIEELKGHKYRAETLTPLMQISTDRFIEYAPKDFFYVLQHDPTPPALADAGGWQPDGGTQPAPSWMAGIWSSKLAGRDGPVELVDIESGRASYRIRAGTKEPDAKTGSLPTTELASADAERVLFALGLGIGMEKHPRGLGTAGRMVMPLRAGADEAAIVVGADGSLAILKSAEVSPMAPNTDLAELPLILDGGDVAPLANIRGPHEARSALGITERGRVVIARGTFATDAPLADALKRAGCTRAVLLDRGSHPSPLFDRAGSVSPPRARYEESILYGLGTPLRPRSFRFDAQTAVSTSAP